MLGIVGAMLAGLRNYQGSGAPEDPQYFPGIRHRWEARGVRVPPFDLWLPVSLSGLVGPERQFAQSQTTPDRARRFLLEVSRRTKRGRPRVS